MQFTLIRHSQLRCAVRAQRDVESGENRLIGAKWLGICHQRSSGSPIDRERSIGLAAGESVRQVRIETDRQVPGDRLPRLTAATENDVTEALRNTGAKVLDEDVGARGKPHQGAQSGRRLQVEDDRALVAVVVQE